MIHTLKHISIPFPVLHRRTTLEFTELTRKEFFIIVTAVYTVLTSDCKKTTFKATGLKDGKNYDFVVRAYVDGKWSEFRASDLVSAKPKASTKPTNVKATAGVNSVTLKWDKVSGATKYKVCYKNGSKYTVLTSDCKTTTYEATGLKAGKKYEFVVRAYVNGKWSDFNASDLVSATPKASTNA